MARQQQPCAQMSVAAGYASHACRTVLLLRAKRRDTQLIKPEIQAANTVLRQADLDVRKHVELCESRRTHFQITSKRQAG